MKRGLRSVETRAGRETPASHENLEPHAHAWRLGTVTIAVALAAAATGLVLTPGESPLCRTPMRSMFHVKHAKTGYREVGCNKVFRGYMFQVFLRPLLTA